MQACRAHTVAFEMLDGRKETVQVEEGDNLLDAMIDAGLEPTHDCKMGVCMTCPARIVRPPPPPPPHPLCTCTWREPLAPRSVAGPITLVACAVNSAHPCICSVWLWDRWTGR